MKKGLSKCVVLAAAVLFLVVQSCTTTYIAEIRPAGVSTFTEAGRTVASVSKAGIDAYLTYLDNPPGMLLFDVQIGNKSENPLILKPTDIYLVPLVNLADNSNSINAMNVTRALDPKNEVKKIAKEIEDEKSGYSAGVFLDLGLTLLGAVIYSAVEDDEEPEVFAEMAGNFILRRADAAVDHDRFIEDLEYRKNFVDNNSLKDTTVSGGAHVYGAIMLPVSSLPRFFKVVVPVNGSYFEFPYEVIIKKY